MKFVLGRYSSACTACLIAKFLFDDIMGQIMENSTNILLMQWCYIVLTSSMTKVGTQNKQVLLHHKAQGYLTNICMKMIDLSYITLGLLICLDAQAAHNLTAENKNQAKWQGDAPSSHLHFPVMFWNKISTQKMPIITSTIDDRLSLAKWIIVFHH